MKVYGQVFAMVAFALFVLTIPFAAYGLFLWLGFYIAGLALAAFAIFIAEVLDATNTKI